MIAAVARVALVALVVLVGGAWTPAAAQVLGIFRWQMEPYCNVVTFTVIQQGPAYQLTGSDNLCGAPAVAPATGTATPNPNGTIALGFSIVTPTGGTAHVNATVTLPSVDGSWTDADGNGGAFRFNGAGGSAPSRPAPTRSTLITSSQLAASIFAGSGVATTIARSDHTHDDRYYTEAETVTVIDAARVTPMEGTGFLPSQITPQTTVTLQTFTTPRAGRLLIATPMNITSVACGGSNVLVMLVLDGVAIGNSVQVRPVSNTLAGMASGLVLTNVPAGAHSLGVGVRCLVGTASGLVVDATGRGQVLILP